MDENDSCRCRSSTAVATSLAIFLAKSPRSCLLPGTLPRHSAMDRTLGPAEGEMNTGETHLDLAGKSDL
jgi:hypothetical protein